MGCEFTPRRSCKINPALSENQEYEARETPESKVVKDLDRFELALQAVEYERCEITLHGDFALGSRVLAQDIRSLGNFFVGSIRTLL